MKILVSELLNKHYQDSGQYTKVLILTKQPILTFGETKHLITKSYSYFTDEFESCTYSGIWKTSNGFIQIQRPHEFDKESFHAVYLDADSTFGMDERLYFMEFIESGSEVILNSVLF